jgi:nucleotidyltransferase/DNA polymerase involved in DNA repair
MNMERSIAIKKLEKLLGKKLAWRINPKAPDAEERQAAREALSTAIAERKALQEQRDARERELLADPEYQRLKAAAKAAAENVESISGITRRHKITVGTNEGIFFLVKAEGDSWEQIIEKLTAKAAA